MALNPTAQAGDLQIKKAKYQSDSNEIEVHVIDAGRRALVTVSDAESGDVLAQSRAKKEGDLKTKIAMKSDLSFPCRVRASTDQGSAIKSVDDAPANCGEGGDPGGDPGGDSGGGIAEHQDLTYTGPGTCLECHENHAMEVFDSTHYQWKGEALYMVNEPQILQGKDAGAVNTYCGNILGNWEGCSACHVGLGARPEPNASTAQLANIDCLICHQEGYKRKKVDGLMQPDSENMTITMNKAVQTVHIPTRTTCLQCHAKAGGGDAVKRGDLALATGNTTDERYDVHMATTGANLLCQDCHVPDRHRFPGKGSDIRPTDRDVTLECASSGCHDASPHDSNDLNRHTARVACQTCHIPLYAKDASDSAADEATETDRSWQAGSDHTTPPLHPVLTKANDLVPVYRHWNRTSDNHLLHDPIYPNPDTGTYETSVPIGAVYDDASKLYPFKYKTSDYPLHIASSKLIALDTKVFFATGDADAATLAGLENMGFDNPDEYLTAYEWVTTDTYQLLNHQVSPDEEALQCNQCHMTTARMDLQGELGYTPTSPSQETCSTGCHSAEKAWKWSYGSFDEYREGHKKHNEKDIACVKCHAFSR